jgi:ParB family chromosome partitioning protein
MALGRGLDSLLGEVELSYDEITKKYDSILEVDIDDIKPNPKQPRKEFDQDKLKELSNSIKNNGLLQPIVLLEDDGYILVSGERRLRASKMAGFKSIKAIVLDVDISKLRELAIIENIQREDLNIIDLALSYEELIKEYNLTHDDLAKKLSKSRTSITNSLRLLNLNDYVKGKILEQKISAGHAKILVSLDDEKQKLVTDSIIGQNLSVRETENLIRSMKTQKQEIVEPKKTFDFKPLDSVIKRFKNDNLNIKIDKNCIKIDISSQEDIERFLKYF